MLRCSWAPPNLPVDYSVAGYTLQYKLADGFDYYPHYGILREQTVDPAMPLSIIEGLQPYGGYLVVLNALISYDLNISAIGSGLLNDSFTSVMITQTSTVNTTLPIRMYITILVQTSLLYNSSINPAIIFVEPGSVVRNLTVNITSPTSVRMFWLPPERVHWRGQIEHYLITATIEGSAGRMKRQGHSSVISREVVPQANHRDPSLATEPLKPETFDLQGLEEYFTYSFSVNVVNGAGASEQSPSVMQSLPAAGKLTLFILWHEVYV